MATVKRRFVFLTCIISGIAALFTIISLATEEWVVTDSAMWVNSGTDLDKFPNTIKYGLFEGTFKQIEPAPKTLQISMTCLLKENVCAVLCAGNTDARYTLLKNIYSGTEKSGDDDPNCPTIRRASTVYYPYFMSGNSMKSNDSKKFINCGIWVSTIFFLVLSLVFGLVSSALSMYNTVSNPIEVYLSVLGLYLYNGIAMGSCLMAMVLWGIMHITTTFHNVAVRQTLLGLMTSDKRASLGYSYWINIISVVFYFGSICVLYARHYLLSKDPVQKIEEREENAEVGIYLY